MVGLLKKEFRESYEIFVPILLLIIVVQVAFFIPYYWSETGLFEQSYQGNAYDVVSIIAIVGLASLVFGMIIAMFTYFYTNIYSDKKYELFTLPVNPLQIIASKVLVALAWFCTYGLSYLGLVIILEKTLLSNITSSQSIDSITKIIEYMFIPGTRLLFLRGYLVKILTVVVAITSILFIGSLTHSKYIQNGRLWKTFCILFLFIVIFLLIDSTFKGVGFYPQFINLNSMTDFFSSRFGYAMESNTVNNLLMFRLTIIIATIYGTNYLWKHKLQL